MAYTKLVSKLPRSISLLTCKSKTFQALEVYSSFISLTTPNV